MSLYIKVGSITNAQRAQKVLKKNGYRSSVRRNDTPSKNDGCGYMIVVDSSSDDPVNILKNHHIEIRGVDRS